MDLAQILENERFFVRILVMTGAVWLCAGRGEIVGLRMWHERQALDIAKGFGDNIIDRRQVTDAKFVRIIVSIGNSDDDLPKILDLGFTFSIERKFFEENDFSKKFLGFRWDFNLETFANDTDEIANSFFRAKGEIRFEKVTEAFLADHSIADDFRPAVICGNKFQHFYHDGYRKVNARALYGVIIWSLIEQNRRNNPFRDAKMLDSNHGVHAIASADVFLEDEEDELSDAEGEEEEHRLDDHEPLWTEKDGARSLFVFAVFFFEKAKERLESAECNRGLRRGDVIKDLEEITLPGVEKAEDGVEKLSLFEISWGSWLHSYPGRQLPLLLRRRRLLLRALRLLLRLRARLRQLLWRWQ